MKQIGNFSVGLMGAGVLVLALIPLLEEDARSFFAGVGVTLILVGGGLLFLVEQLKKGLTGIGGNSTDPSP